MNLIQLLILNRIRDVKALPAAMQSQIIKDQALHRMLAENEGLHALRHGLPLPPHRKAMLERTYIAAQSTQESNMNFIHKLFSSKHLILRFGVAVLLLFGLLALSLLLPRAVLTPRGMEVHGAQPAYAATEGYMLLYEFTSDDVESLKPLIEQLTAAVREFKKAHGLPDDQQAQDVTSAVENREIEKTIVVDSAELPADAKTQEVTKSATIVAVSLPDAALLDELKAELAKIPGLPEPEVKDATWFNQKGLPLPSEDGISLELGLNDKQHAFTFPKNATEGEIEKTINAWLSDNHPEMQFDVTVDKNVDGNECRMGITITSTSDSADSAGKKTSASVSTSSSSSSSEESSSSHESSGSESGSSSASGGGGGSATGGGGGNASGGGGGNATGGGGGGGSTSSKGGSASSDHAGQAGDANKGLEEFRRESAAAKKEMEKQMADWKAKHANEQDEDAEFDKLLNDGDGAKSGGGKSSSSSSHSSVKMSRSQTGDGDIEMTLNVDGKEHTFKFASDASEADIAKQVKNWTKEAFPGKDYKVTVKKSTKGNKTELELQLESTESSKE